MKGEAWGREEGRVLTCPGFRGSGREVNPAQSPSCSLVNLAYLGIGCRNSAHHNAKLGGRIGRVGSWENGYERERVPVCLSPHIHILCTSCNACRCTEMVARNSERGSQTVKGRHPVFPLLTTRWQFRPANLSEGSCRHRTTWWQSIFPTVCTKFFFF